MRIDLSSFSGEQLLSAFATHFRKDAVSINESGTSVDYELPYGKIKCWVLNSGLTFGSADLNKNNPGIIMTFNEKNAEVPYKIGFCQSGRFCIDYTSENISKVIAEGTNLIVTPRAGSSLLVHSSCPVKFTYIFISPDFLKNYFSIKPEDEFLPNINNQKGSAFQFAEGINSPYIKLIFSQLQQDNFPKSLYGLMLESKSIELLSLFFQQFIVPHDNFCNTEKDKIFNAHQYIISNLDKTITVRDLMARYGLNEHKLQTSFKALFGSTVQQHIKKLRLQKARSLMLCKNYSVSEAGYTVGYTNMSHFATAFRQEYGLLPSEAKNPLRQLVTAKKLK